MVATRDRSRPSTVPADHREAQLKCARCHTSLLQRKGRAADIFACMQVSAPSTDELADQLLGFMAYLMKTTQGGVFQVAGELELTLSQLRALFVLAYGDHAPALSELAH